MAKEPQDQVVRKAGEEGPPVYLCHVCQQRHRQMPPSPSLSHLRLDYARLRTLLSNGAADLRNPEPQTICSLLWRYENALAKILFLPDSVDSEDSSRLSKSVRKLCREPLMAQLNANTHQIRCVLFPMSPTSSGSDDEDEDEDEDGNRDHQGDSGLSFWRQSEQDLSRQALWACITRPCKTANDPGSGPVSDTTTTAIVYRLQRDRLRLIRRLVTTHSSPPVVVVHRSSSQTDAIAGTVRTSDGKGANEADEDNEDEPRVILQ